MKNQLVSPLILFFTFFSFIYCQSNPIQDFDGIKRINNTNIYFKIIGSGEPLLIVHGGPGLGYNYLYEPFSQLADNYRLIFYDQRGCGLSDPINPKDSVNMTTLVDDLEQIRKELALSKLVLVGQSWGALISIEYASKYPDNVSKLLLLEPGPGSSEYLADFQQTIMNRLSTFDKNRIVELSQKPELKYTPKLFNEFMNLRYKGYSLNTTFVDKMYMTYFDSLRIVKFFSSSTAFSRYLMNFNLYKQMENIDCPTLIIHGEFDPIPNQAIERMGKAISASELHIIKNCGHFVHIEKPEEYFDIIRSFFKSH